MRLDKYTKSSIIRAIMDDVPAPDKAKRRADLQAAVVKVMSPEVRKVYNKTPSALRTHHVGDVIYDGYGWNTRDIIAGDVTDKVIEEIIKPYKAEDEARHATKRKLQGIVEGCSTLKQLQTLLPEFKQYMPTETAPTKNLPAVANMVADLSKLGWPKGKTSTK
jgi:hypothetical protein